MSIQIYNTLTGTKERFEAAGPRVKMYVCGMTPKFDPHLGHAKLFVTMDVLRRYLAERGYDVLAVQNFTDVDDKIIVRGHREGLTPEAVAEKYTDSYFRSMQALNVMPADVYPKATETIAEIIEMIDGLITRGFAYPADNGDVFYSVAAFPPYGKLSHRSADDVLAGARIQVEPNKRDARDFALWKAAKPGEPAWDSAWGPGRPGWHIECSAMVRRWLGDQIDIHAGGPDLIFPHHENEIAQSEAFTGKEPFARYWVHIGQLNVNNEKMAHSLENFTTVLDVLRRYEPVVLRLYLLQQQYRRPVTFIEQALIAAQKGVERLLDVRDRLRALAQLEAPLVCIPPVGQAAELASAVDTLRTDFYASMDDDFNTAEALAALFTFARAVNRIGDTETGSENPAAIGSAARSALAEIERLLAILGLVLPTVLPDDAAAPVGITDRELEKLLEERARLRGERRFAEADAIRKQLAQHGITIEDRQSGTTWRRGSA